MGPSHGLDPCASFPMALEVIVKPLADISLLEEVLRFQGMLSSSRSSWGEGPSSSSTTPFWVPDSSTLGEDRKWTTLFLKRWGGSSEWEVVNGPLSMVLQDGSEVVFL